MTKWWMVVGCVLALAACGGGSDDDETDEKDSKAAACEQPKSQGLSQACCEDHGVDACGAGLFCAAFDGREQSSCYLERSRLDGDSCSEDRQCVSGGCNTEAGVCRATPMAPCDPSIGCAAGPLGGKHVCLPETETCQPVDDGAWGKPCELSEDCEEGLVCGDESTCIYEGLLCGTYTGKGPCIDDPNGTECQICRIQTHENICSNCNVKSEITADFSRCAEASGCFGDDLACILEACSAESCAVELCVHDCWNVDEHGCY